jgi:hypothetical protein
VRQDREAGEKVSREQVRPGLRLRLLVRVDNLLNDVRDGIQEEDEERQLDDIIFWPVFARYLARYFGKFFARYLAGYFGQFLAKEELPFLD